MRYFTCFESDDSRILSMAGGSSQAVFPDTSTGVDAFRVYLNEFTVFGEWVIDGNANLYFADGPDPVELPFNMNLNYVDLDSAKSLDDKNLKTAIKIMSNYGDDAIINAGDYFDFESKEWVQDPNAWKMNHNREHLIYILSCVAKTVGPVVTSQSHLSDRLAMANQVLVTEPLVWKRMSRERALELIGGESKSFHMPGGWEASDESDEDEFGLGFNSWKEEKFRDFVAFFITEDPDLFNFFPEM